MKNIVNTVLVMSLLAGCSNTSASSEKKITTYANTSIAEVFDTVYSYTEYTASQTDARLSSRAVLSHSMTGGLNKDTNGLKMLCTTSSSLR